MQENKSYIKVYYPLINKYLESHDTKCLNVRLKEYCQQNNNHYHNLYIDIFCLQAYIVI